MESAIHAIYRKMLKSHIKSLIMECGYITLDHFFSIVTKYYYNKENNLGSSGDFITAPESGQLFGEIIAVWCLKQWLECGCKKVNLLELGPGRGYLMQDILRSVSQVPDFKNSIEQVILIENSQTLKEKQALALSEYNDINIKWFDAIPNSIDKNHTIIIANEFFDALPIKQFLYTKAKGFQEIVVILKNEELSLAQVPIMFDSHLPNIDFPCADDGVIFEYSPVSMQYAEGLLRILQTNHGSAIIIDYGYIKSPGKSTIQTMQGQKSGCNLLENIGDADITSLVNFEMLRGVFKMSENFKCNVTTQREFLMQHGIMQRFEHLMQSAKISDTQKQNLKMQLERLVKPNKMGTLFKILEVHGRNAPHAILAA